MASLPSIKTVKLRIVYDSLSIAVTLIFAVFFLQNQHRKYRGWHKHWPLSEQISAFFAATALGILIIWLILSTRERLQLIEFLRDYGRGEIPLGYTPPPMTVWGLKMKFISGYGYFVGIWGVKAAFLAGYWRLRGTLHRPIRLLLYTTAVYTIVTFLANILLHTFSCRPISLNWTGGTERRCFSFAILPNLTVLLVTNISTDLLILLIPLLIIRTFMLRKHETYSLAFVFVVGITSIVAMALRYGFAWREDAKGEGVYGIVENEWRKVFMTLEATCAGCAFCMPAMRRAVRGFVARRGWGSETRAVDAGDRGRGRLEEGDGRVARGATVDSGLGVTEMQDLEEQEVKDDEAVVYASDEDKT